MVDKPEILGLILARGGSKGIPKKNIKLLGSHPLIAYTIKTALESKYINRLVVTTDDENIAHISKRYGAEVPFMRPADLAQDNTLDYPVICHALKWLENNEDYTPNIIVQLRPTSPLRPKGLIDDAIVKLIENENADSVRGVTSPNQSPYKMWKKLDNEFITPLISTELKESFNMPRQELPESFWQTGHIDVIKTKTIFYKESLSGQNILPIFIENQYCIDIDRKEDLIMAEILIETLVVDIDIPDNILLEKLRNIELVVFDFDGVFTNNKVILNEDGLESVICDRSDGMGISMIKEEGISVIILSTEKNEVVSQRGKKLGLMVYQSINDKLDYLKNHILLKENVDLDNVAYVGNDLNDLESMKKVGLSICPNDSHNELKKIADIILSKNGGDGAVREICDLIIKNRKLGSNENR